MKDNMLLNKILHNIKDFDEYIKNNKDILRTTKEKERLSINFNNSNKIRNLIVIRSYYDKEEKNSMIKYKLFNEDGYKIENIAIYDDLKIEEIIKLIHEYKSPTERKFDVKHIDYFLSIKTLEEISRCYENEYLSINYKRYKEDVHFYENNYFYILEYKEYLIKADKKNILKTEYYKNLEQVDNIPKDVLNLLENNLKYIVGYRKDTDIIELNNNKLIEYDTLINSLKQTDVYKKAEIKASKQKTIDIRNSFIGLGSLGLLSYLCFFKGFISLFLLIFSILCFGYDQYLERERKYGKIFGPIRHNEKKILHFNIQEIETIDGKYVSLNKEHNILSNYKPKEKDIVLLEKSKEEIKQIENPTKKEIIINKSEDEEIESLLITTRELIKNNQSINNNLLESYIVPEINNLVSNYNKLDEESREYLFNNIKELNDKLENDKDYNDNKEVEKLKIDSKVLYQQLQEI